MIYSARQGDIIWIDFDPQAGHEQRGRRPAVVVSNDTFHRLFKKAAMVCPITTNNRGLPNQLQLDNRTVTSGVIMTDHAKILDISKRRAEFIEALPKDLLLDVVDVVYSFLHVENDTE